MTIQVFAPAKVNLYLHIVGRRPDGYHLLDSLVAFVDIGDTLSVAPAASLSLTVDGSEAGELGEIGEDNLVLRAARLLASASRTTAGAAIHLEKRLPVASGIGGGSSDAAAALRALGRLWGCTVDPAGALGLGADVPACLAATPVWVGGIGEHLEPAIGLPPAGIVLANPRSPLPTADVFRRRRGGFTPADRFAAMPGNASALAALLAARRNDLTDAAISIVPEITEVLEQLASLPGALLSRMSGSGATCFALFADRAAAVTAHKMLVQGQPRWWSAAGALTMAAPTIESDAG